MTSENESPRSLWCPRVDGRRLERVTGARPFHGAAAAEPRPMQPAGAVRVQTGGCGPSAEHHVVDRRRLEAPRRTRG